MHPASILHHRSYNITPPSTTMHRPPSSLYLPSITTRSLPSVDHHPSDALHWSLTNTQTLPTLEHHPPDTIHLPSTTTIPRPPSISRCQNILTVDNYLRLSPPLVRLWSTWHTIRALSSNYLQNKTGRRIVVLVVVVALLVVVIWTHMLYGIFALNKYSD